MTEQLYEWMAPQQPSDALEEYLTERAPALEHLCSDMADHGFNPSRVLEGTIDSVAPVWE
ncbi:hypothetical protein [Kocuria aegyptia]